LAEALQTTALYCNFIAGPSAKQGQQIYFQTICNEIKKVNWQETYQRKEDLEEMIQGRRISKDIFNLKNKNSHLLSIYDK
jgi:hypothetical protein